MIGTAFRLGLAASLLAVAACDNQRDGNANQTAAGAGEEGGGKTIGAGLDQNSRFFQAAKAAGLDATLAGPGPYTVLVPADAAFAANPAADSASWATPEGRSRLTALLTYHILPGTVLSEDIGKAIDNAKGKAVLATMGGGTITATREGGGIVLTDGSGAKVKVTGADEKFSNGVIHRIDGVLAPAAEAEPQG